MNPDQRLKRPVGTAKSPNPGRTTEGSGTSRSHLYIDDETLQRMIETFGPLEYSQFAATYNPNIGETQDPFGMPMNWQQEMEWPHSQESGAKRKSKSPHAEKTATPPYVLPQMQTEGEESTPGTGQAQRESILEWFDRSVEKELEKRRKLEGPTAAPPIVDPALAPLKAKHAKNLSKGVMERIAETSASRVEIAARLETDFTTELTDAVEKLAKAEAMCSYAEALQAAEEAAQNAPPELAEQAAAAEARRIQTEFTRVKETVPGVRPIEVVGYVGITKPVTPKKST